MRFKTKVDWFYKSIILFLLAVFIVGEVSIYQNKNTFEAIIFGLIFLLIISFLIAAIFTTHFTFESDHLLCKYSFWKIKIQYATIKKIERQESILYGGWKMSTAAKGLIVHYNSYDELLITPENEDEFILMFNSKIRQKNV
ncbi:MAG: hypothetical protein EBY31_01645 [Flavobacteriia bacterium]|nr:hypothetical protein [Flavobacteriia bacterium]